MNDSTAACQNISRFHDRFGNWLSVKAKTVCTFQIFYMDCSIFHQNLEMMTGHERIQDSDIIIYRTSCCDPLLKTYKKL